MVFKIEKNLPHKSYLFWVKGYIHEVFHPTKMYLFLHDKHQICIFFKDDLKTVISVSVS